MVTAILFPLGIFSLFLLSLSFFGIFLVQIFFSWNRVHKWANGNVVKVLERLQSLDHRAHCWSLLRPVAQALICQCSRLPSPCFRVLAFHSRVQDPAKFPGLIQHWSCPLYQILLSAWTALVHRPSPCQNLQQYHSKAIHIAHCCQVT